jgi:hypothetical protein
MACSLAVAAAATGLNKSTVLRAIKAGRISGTRNELGEWQVEPAEAHRVYPPVAAATEGTSAVPQHADAAADLEILRQRASLADERLAELKAALESMRQQRDKWQAQAERLAGMALTDHRPRPWWAFTDASKL